MSLASKAQRAHFVCQSCGTIAPRWTGKCAACGQWNTLSEEAAAAPLPGSGVAGGKKGRLIALALGLSAIPFAPLSAQTPAKTTPAGVAPIDALIGPFLDVFLHEAGHAVFGALQIPLFGREEDAAVIARLVHAGGLTGGPDEQ